MAMNFKTYEISVDLINNTSTTSTIRFSQNDQNSAKLLLNITNKTVEMDLSTVTSVRMSFKKPDGTRVFQDDCQPINALKGKYQIILKTQTLAAVGKVIGQVHIEENGRVIDTQKIVFEVDESLSSDDAVESTNEFGIIQKAIDAGEKLEGVDIPALIESKETADAALAKSTENTNQIGILSELETTNKTNLVKAINEAKNSGLTEQQKQDLAAAKTDASTAKTDAASAKTEATTARTEKIPATRLDTSSDANKIKQINLSDEVKQMMAGTTPVNATPQDGSVTYQKTAFLEIKYDNLVDVSKLAEGYLSGTGTVTASTAAYLTDFIPVVYGKTYISKIANGGTWGSHYYKSDKTGVKRITLNADNSFTVDDNTVAYVRLVFYPKPTDNKDMMMVEGKVYPNSYIPYEERVNITDQKFEKAIGKVAKVKVDEGLADIANVLPDKSITASKTNFLYEKRINLYDPSKAVSGTINQTTGAVSPFAGAWASDFIPVVEGKTYKTNATFNSGFYDSNKSFVQGLANYNGTVTAPTGKDIKYVRMSYNGDANAAMFVEGEFLPTTYIPYTRIEIAPIDATTKQGLLRQLDKLNGLKWNCLGDSITFGMGGRPYHQWIYDRTGIIPRNYGVSSTSIAVRSGRTDSMVERYTSMLDDADIITVLGGVNDKGNAVPLGTMNDRINTTFYGACHILFKGLVEKYKGKRFGVISPLPTYAGNDALKSYVDAEREVARFYSIPFLDMYNEGGLSATLDSMQVGYIPDGLHPNDEGHKVISRRIEAFLRAI